MADAEKTSPKAKPTAPAAQAIRVRVMAGQSLGGKLYAAGDVVMVFDDNGIRARIAEGLLELVE